MLDLLEKLKRKYKLAALTTISREWLDYKKAKYNLDSYFELIISSGYSGFKKPNLEIYRIILEKLNKKPEECLFIDDSLEALLPAKKLGIKTILFSGQSDLEKNLKKLKIK